MLFRHHEPHAFGLGLFFRRRFSFARQSAQAEGYPSAEKRDAFGCGDGQEGPVEVERAILEEVASDWEEIGHVGDDREQHECVNTIAMGLPACVHGQIGQGQQDIESGLQGGGREVAEAGLVPRSDVFGVVGVGEPFAVVGVAEEEVSGDQECERRDKVGDLPYEFGADPLFYDEVLEGEPGEAAGG